MLSNKLTFSLASLVVLLMVGLCLPAAAQEIVSLAIDAPTGATGDSSTLEAGRDTDGFAEGSFGLYAHTEPTNGDSASATTVAMKLISGWMGLTITQPLVFTEPARVFQ